MNIAALITAISAAVQAVVSALRPKTAGPPAPSPQPTGFAAIDRAEQERLARESAASVPPVGKP